MAASVQTQPQLICSGCQAAIDLGGRRVGDSMSCPRCSSLQVITRSKTRGDVPTVITGGGLDPHERREVDEALRRIKLRRVGHATRHLKLFPSWAIFLAGVQFYLSGILAGQNLIVQGSERAGRRLQILGVVSYLLLGAAMLAGAFLLGDRIPPAAGLGVLLAVPLAFAAYFTSAQHAPCAAAREAGAGDAPVFLPLLLGLILAIAQAFAVWFLKLRLDGPF